MVNEPKRIPINFNNSEMNYICELCDFLKQKPQGISTYLCKAFDYSESNIYSTEKSNLMIFEVYRIQYFSNKYNIKTLCDLSNLLESESVMENKPLPKAKRILFSFHLDIPLEKKVYNKLEPLSNRERISVIANAVGEYMVSGYDITYLEYSVDKLLGYLKSCYLHGNGEMLEKTIELINAPIETRFTPFFLTEQIKKIKK